jgi:outer membrane protein
MKKIAIVLTVIINFFIVDNLQAEIKISYLDLDKVVSTSLAGKSINDQFITLQKNNQKKFKTIEDKLFEKEKSIISQKNVLEKSEYEKKVLSFKQEVQEHNVNKSNLIKELNTKRLKATTKLLDNLNPILSDYSNEQSISLVIQKKNIIIGKTELDITEEILKLLNKKVKKINIK